MSRVWQILYIIGQLSVLQGYALEVTSAITRIYEEGVAPYDKYIGELQLAKQWHQQQTLASVVQALKRGRLADNVVKWPLLTQASYQQVMQDMPTIRDIRVGQWSNQGEYAVVSVHILTVKESKVVQLLFSIEKETLIALRSN